ncbi:MAG: hypothetical protein U9N55_08645 [candidate division Zixibacteria bacterium]|nr:hypothetical protein [candidate division Zixibacteria bacterium]
MIKNTLDLDFISRTLRTTGIVLLILLPFGLYYLDFYPSLAILSGAIWSIINVIFLRSLVITVIQPDDIDKWRALGFAFIKFPLLYFSGYCLLKVSQFEPWHLLVGFSIPLVIMILKAVGRALLGLDDSGKLKELH